MRHLNFGIIFIGLSLAVSGCQTMNQNQVSTQSKTPTDQKKLDPQEKTPDGIKITPYDRPEIKREQLQIVIPNQTPVQPKFEDGRQLPAFKNLMQQTQTAYQKANWDDAEKTALQAQRLAPQASETYMYLAMIANQKNDPKNAESLAKRGLSYAQTNTMKKQLWQVILKSAHLQKNAKLITEAQNQIKTF